MRIGEYVVAIPVQSEKSELYNVELKGQITRILENTFVFETNRGIFLGKKDG
ncbi:hypothetical protein [Enterococcus faecium]|uniref:hypothetical protein n=1 Tax=Enterococcus faecium TaxID=1352 RepID=UPI0015C42675|nr:hypothetical protein [Enterococcus faecium]